MCGSPLVIVGLGGSGTRVFARLAEASGRHMGEIQNESNDALALYDFADRWCEPVHVAWQAGAALPDRAGFEADLADSLARHRGGADPEQPWGWKQPRSIHLLPALERAYAGELLVLHVMRDGRDLALRNPIHLQQTWPFLVPDALRDAGLQIQMAHAWATVNALAADFGESTLGKRYLRVSLEDLCAEPDTAASAILSFGGGEISPGLVAGLVDRPTSIGTWRDADPVAVAAIVGVAGEALDRFGYA